MLIYRMLRSEIRNIARILCTILYLVIIIASLVLISQYTWEAVKLRSWKNDTGKYIAIKRNFNMRDYHKFVDFFKLNKFKNNASNENSITTSYDNSDVGVTEAHTSSVSTEETITETAIECKPEPPKDDFLKCGARVADRKCCEYIWAWKYKDDLMERADCLSGLSITGGFEAQPGEFPHMVALGYERLNKTGTDRRSWYSYMCGGSLISEQFVLTAGHCTILSSDKDHRLEPAVVAMGGEVLSEEMSVVKIDKIFTHEQYQSPKVYYDIALLKLREKVIFTNRIHPACLNTALHPQHTVVNVTGWGTTDSKDLTHMTDHLLVGTVNIIDRQRCASMESYNRNFEKLLLHQFCAGDQVGGTDTCQGDSGGPLQVKLNTTYGNIHSVIGVTSFGKDCGSAIPSVYVSVSRVLTWIEKKVWPNYNKDYIEGLGLN